MKSKKTKLTKGNQSCTAAIPMDHPDLQVDTQEAHNQAAAVILATHKRQVTAVIADSNKPAVHIAIVMAVITHRAFTIITAAIAAM